MSRRFTPKRILLAGLFVALIGIFSLGFYQVGNYFSTLDRFSGDISRGDITASKEDLREIKSYYDLNKKLEKFHLSWVADKYVFENPKTIEAAFFYNMRDMEKVISELETEDGFWAYYIRANARFRLAQDMYANALNLQDKKKIKEQLNKADEIAKTTKDDYLEAIRSDPNDTLEPKWNYDLVTDDGARAAALMPKPPKIKSKLGIPIGRGGTNQGPEGDKDGKKGNKPKGLEEKSDQLGKAQGKPKKVG